MAEGTKTTEKVTMPAGGGAPGTNNGQPTEATARKRTEAGGRIVKDPELVAMQEVTDILEGLDEPTRKRVTLWIIQRYGAAVLALVRPLDEAK